MSQSYDEPMESTSTSDVPGGRYLQNGKWINAHGEVLGDAQAAPQGALAGQGTVADQQAAAQRAVAPAPGAVDPSTMTLAELEDALDGITDPAQLRALQDAEAAGQARAGATKLFDARRAQLEG